MLCDTIPIGLLKKYTDKYYITLYTQDTLRDICLGEGKPQKCD